MRSLSRFFADAISVAVIVAGLSTSALAQTNPGSGSSSQAPSSTESNFITEPSQQPNVMVPGTAGDMSINSIVNESPSFEMFNALLRVADIEGAELGEKLGGDEETYTIYAPTDEAFAALPEGVIKALVQPANRGLLEQILSYHVIEGEVSADQPMSSASAAGEVASPTQVDDASSSPLGDMEAAPVMRSDRGGMMVNDARIIGTAIQASNGTIYAVDRVILPPSVQNQLSALIPAGATAPRTSQTEAPNQNAF